MNLEKFRTVVELIVAHPESWDQSRWNPNECGTACCLAGNTRLIFSDEKGPQVGEIIKFSQKTLELTRAEASYLFHESRTLQDFLDVLNDGYVFRNEFHCRSGHTAKTWEEHLKYSYMSHYLTE